MKKIKLAITYVFALLCIYVGLYNKIDTEYVNNITDNESKIVIFTLKDDSLVPISLIYDKEKTVEKNIQLTFELMKDGINEFGFNSAIPKSVQLLNVNIENDLVKLNFNEAIYMMNSKYELRFFEAVVNSVLQYNNEYKIQFCVNGEIIDRMPLSNRKMVIFDKRLGINNFKLETNDLYQSDSKMVIEYVIDSDYSYYIINSIRVDKEIELLEFVNMVLNNKSTLLLCEKIEWKDDIMIIHLNERFLFDENTISKEDIMDLIYTLKVNEYSDKFILKVNNEVKRIEDYKNDIFTIKDLNLNVFEQ